jgi:hypothetical protein
LVIEKLLLVTHVQHARRAHYSCDSVDVCGVQGRVSDISPLEGENEDDDDEHHERGQRRRKRR